MLTALLLSVGVLLVAHFVFHVNVFAFSFKALGEMIVAALKWCRVFLKKFFMKTFGSIFIRRLLRPFFTLIGFTWLVSYSTDFFKTRVIPRAALILRFIMTKWRKLPWYLQTAFAVGGLIVAFILGFGLWLIPVGMSFYSRLLTKAHVIWTDSWIRKKTGRFMHHARRHTYRLKKKPVIRHHRMYRHWALKRHRRLNKWADRRIGQNVVG